MVNAKSLKAYRIDGDKKLYSEYVVEEIYEAWECESCEEVYEDERDAEDCCGDEEE